MNGNRLHQTLTTLFLLLTSQIVSASVPNFLLPSPNTSYWCGYYVGGDLGGSWMKADMQFTNPNFFNTLGPVELGTRFYTRAKSVIGGANAGFLFQAGAVVLGLEASLWGADLNAKDHSPFFPTDNYNTDINYFTLARGRIGYAYQQWLPYLTGGWAGSEVYMKLDDTANHVVATSKKWSNGWTAGAGFDYRMDQTISLGIVYNYIQLIPDTNRAGCATCGKGVGLGTPSTKGHINTQSVTARLNFLVNQA